MRVVLVPMPIQPAMRLSAVWCLLLILIIPINSKPRTRTEPCSLLPAPCWPWPRPLVLAENTNGQPRTYGVECHNGGHSFKRCCSGPGQPLRAGVGVALDLKKRLYLKGPGQPPRTSRHVMHVFNHMPIHMGRSAARFVALRSAACRCVPPIKMIML
jgi:hypothetical protein